MNKTKALALGLGIGIPVAICAIAAGTIVGIKAQREKSEIDPQVKYGTHVQKLVHSPIYQNEDFTVTVPTYDEGYAKIDTTTGLEAKTVIKIDGNVVPYTLTAHNTIKVDGKYVTSTNISMQVEMQRTVSKMSFAWKEAPKPGFGSVYYREVGQKLTANDFVVKMLWGNEKDGEWKDATPGTGEGYYSVYKAYNNEDSKDITPSLKSGGYELTQKDLKVTKIGDEIAYDTLLYFVHISETYTSVIDTRFICCREATGIEFDKDEGFSPTTVKCGATARYYSIISPSAALSGFDQYKIVKDEDQTGSTITSHNKLTAGATPGKITIRVSAMQNPEVIYKDMEVEIVAA